MQNVSIKLLHRQANHLITFITESMLGDSYKSTELSNTIDADMYKVMLVVVIKLRIKLEVQVFNVWAGKKSFTISYEHALCLKKWFDMKLPPVKQLSSFDLIYLKPLHEFLKQKTA
jgi:hypothetical protein